MAEIYRLVASDMALEVVQCGNVKTALHAVRTAREAGANGRLILGNDAPSGTGIIPLGILRTISLLAAGDLVGISMVLVDGTITIGRSRNTPPATRPAEVVKGTPPHSASH